MRKHSESELQKSLTRMKVTEETKPEETVFFGQAVPEGPNTRP